MPISVITSIFVVISVAKSSLTSIGSSLGNRASSELRSCICVCGVHGSWDIVFMIIREHWSGLARGGREETSLDRVFWFCSETFILGLFCHLIGC